MIDHVVAAGLGGVWTLGSFTCTLVRMPLNENIENIRTFDSKFEKNTSKSIISVIAERQPHFAPRESY